MQRGHRLLGARPAAGGLALFVWLFSKRNVVNPTGDRGRTGRVEQTEYATT